MLISPCQLESPASIRPFLLRPASDHPVLALCRRLVCSPECISIGSSEKNPRRSSMQFLAMF